MSRRSTAHGHQVAESADQAEVRWARDNRNRFCDPAGLLAGADWHLAKARAWLAEVEGETAALVAELKSWDRHDRISAVSCITVSPKRRRLGLDFHLLPDHANAHGEDTVAFLKQLKRHIPGPMTILRDKGNIHDRSKVVRPTWRSTPRSSPRSCRATPPRRIRTSRCGGTPNTGGCRTSRPRKRPSSGP